jgi:hypothetical protein
MDEFPFDLLASEHERILKKAQSKGITIRLLGAMAFELHCSQYAVLRRELGRKLSDLDYAALSKQWGPLIDVMKDLGYEFDERRAMLHGLDRVIFFHPEGIRVDVFFDRLDMCHNIDFRDRLQIDPETISLADLLLEKMQIVRITEKDIIDMIILCLANPITENDEGINATYIAKRLSHDWGFYFTATTNLKRIQNEFLDRYHQLSEADRNLVRSRIAQLLSHIEAIPKTTAWRLRSQIGPRVKWYKDVGELERKPEDGAE